MPLPWVRLDTAMPDHPKILELIESHGDAGMAAAFVWVCSMAYAGKHNTSGFISRGALARCNGKPKHAALLVQARLWDEAERGWQIHDFEDFNMVALDVETFSPQSRSNGGKSRMARLSPEERSALGRKGAQARWDASN